MRNTKMPFVFAILLLGALAGPSFGQQPERVFNWLPGNQEDVRLDPANYHAGQTYHASGDGGNMQVDIKSEQPVTIFLVHSEEWNAALQHPESLNSLQQLCTREHVVETRYSCYVPPVSMTLIIRDERYSPDHAVFAGLGAVLDPSNKVERAVGSGITEIAAIVASRQSSAPRHFNAPNDVHIQYFRWLCVGNCIQPEFRWIEQVKEKYQLTSFLKVYGGYTPDHDAAQVSIKIKSPVPMVVAMIPSNIANQLHARPEMFEAALEKNSCQQRGVQSLEFQCTFNLADGPQSLIVAPEANENIPHKKAEIEMQFVKCVANCALLESKQ
jgi:hypothetical protein